MVKTFIGVREVDGEVFRRFRARAVENKIRLGKALSLAMKEFLEERKQPKVDIRNLDKINGMIKPGKKVRWSEEIDEILYGGESDIS
ncbi:MAG: hypothetical protein KJ600_02210 [Nanoarchaeota archaeon]|nr:hypothetical protein [Nanoarchaeota archaeon]MBU1103348.1 hypothetical protein [Nanoarchaeota archaeon]